MRTVLWENDKPWGRVCILKPYCPLGAREGISLFVYVLTEEGLKALQIGVD